ncbi:cyclase family protein [Leifsonia kafniensis]|uniref:Cyclase family protein n=2 Tax=Leifsonia kafniensis TaxID=475957 RepID=A0ABP7KUP0_9MICO
MSRDEANSIPARTWKAPTYEVTAAGKVIGGYTPTGVNNWGRWGENDVLGTTNLITPEIVANAAKLISTGRVISMALPIGTDAPAWSGRPAPQHYFTMTGTDIVASLSSPDDEPSVTFTDDYVTMAMHASTQWDSFAHWALDGVLYNGFWVGNVTAAGSRDLDISQLKESLVGRGVLLDLPRLLGVDFMEPGTLVTPQMLDDAAAKEGVEIRSGDIVIIRTGHVERWYTLETDAEREDWNARVPGVGRDTIAWLHAQDVGALVVDNPGCEVVPNELPMTVPYPFHGGALVDLGLPLGELWSLGAIADACAADGVYEFFVSAPPLNLPGGVGSVISPIAIK